MPRTPPEGRLSVTFVVAGAEGPIDAQGTRAAAAGRHLPAGAAVKHSIRVASRGAGGAVRATAVEGEDAVVLHVAGGPELVLNPSTARALLRAQQGARAARAAEAERDAAVEVPATLRWRGLEESVPGGVSRGGLADVLLSGVEVITGLFQDRAAGALASMLAAALDGQVDEGVYRLSPDALPTLAGSGRKVDLVPPAEGPTLILAHGTFVETASTFGKLWSRHPDRVHAIFRRYQDRVYALDHRTLSASPIANALSLARAMPKGARLHLLTHSRGGLVAEVLARVCARRGELAAEDRAPFDGDALAAERAALEDLAREVRDRALTVERVVRVACPARGTLLASRRLDAYLSVFKWALELAHVPVAPQLVDLVYGVTQQRRDWERLPGLAALIPDSPLVQWLHAGADPIPGDLRVIAGDLEGDSVTSWVKTLLSDAFYWTDNDLVVQTRSMYGGPPRSGGARFLLDRGGKVSHLDYFSNDRTAAAVVDALDDEPRGFEPIGPLSWAGRSSTGVRAVRRDGRDGRSPSDLPAVLVVPDLLGSHLAVNGARIWLGAALPRGLEPLAYDEGQREGPRPDGLLDSVYGDLVEFLSATHEVIPFAYDWRRPLEHEAVRLADEIVKALELREATGKPVRLLAHGMGGLLARTVQLERAEAWNRLMARQGARVLMLGPPNAGSFAPMQLLSGDDTLGNALALAGPPFEEHRVRAVLAGFPGLLQLQAGLLDAFGVAATWRELAEKDLARVGEQLAWHGEPIQLDPFRWGLPSQAVLDRAAALRRRLDGQRPEALGTSGGRIAIVVGTAAATPSGIVSQAEGLAYVEAPEGDGRVTLASARLPGVATWRVERDHGALPSASGAFEAYRELLERGETALLQPVSDAAAAGSAGRGASRPARARPDVTPPRSERALFAAPAAEPRRVETRPPVQVTVENGNLKLVREPILVGHYRSPRLTGTEEVLDHLIGGALGTALALGAYPDGPGTHAVFSNPRPPPDDPRRLPRPAGVVVVGLGDEGKLGAADLVFTVRQGVIEWARHLAESSPGGGSEEFDLAATLIGSGGLGISAGQAALCVVQGIGEANERLATTEAAGRKSGGRPGWPRVRRVRLVELYRDRAREAWRALQAQAAMMPGAYEIDDCVAGGVPASTGAMVRLGGSGYRGAHYDFISATMADGATVSYTLDTRRARGEVHAQITQGKMVQEFVKRASMAGHTDAELGRTLFRLLVPPELEAFLLGTSDLEMALDSHTAAVPWEMLDPVDGRGSDARPWAIRTRLVRKLLIDRFRETVVDAGPDAHALVIGEPKADERYPRLPGARAEARAVAERLAAALGASRVTPLIAPDGAPDRAPEFVEVVRALLSRDWRIVHIAGHGAPPDGTEFGGVVLSNGMTLGPREIHCMRVAPELVFVNCCHLASMVDSRPEGSFGRAQLAANVAEGLIREGVRCVVAAGWAVDDEAARTFATAFYDAALGAAQRPPLPFGEAVERAREAAYACGGNTWAAYQCYGDRDWVLRTRPEEHRRAGAPRPSVELEAIASAYDLRIALETLATALRHGDDRRGTGPDLDAIRALETRYAPRWGGSGAVAEGFGAAYAEARQVADAIRWYRKAVDANDGGATLRATEQLGDLLARDAEERVRTPRPPVAGVRGADPDPRQQVRNAIALLQALLTLGTSTERESLCGAAFKRLALVERAAGRPDEEAQAVAAMRAHYAEAERIAREASDPGGFYPALNRIAAEVLAGARGDGREKVDEEARAATRRSLVELTERDPDFWSMAALVELDCWDAVSGRRLAAAAPGLEAAFVDLHGRVPAGSMWSSVRDQAHFVLDVYAPKGRDEERAAERAAADRLLRMLDGFAATGP